MPTPARSDQTAAPNAVRSLGSQRELFWDDALVDCAQTTAELRLHSPQARDVVLTHDAPWEGDGCDYHCILADDGLYRMYYLAWEMLAADVSKHVPRPIVVAYAESTDGLHWIKPDLGLCEFGGSTHNNIILDQHTASFDNFSVFKDRRPDCPPDEVYKGVGSDGNDRFLWCFTSADGINFRKAWPMTKQGKFDSLNIAFWDRHRGEYVCYLRDFHAASGEDFAPGAPWGAGVRDIRQTASADFRTWSTPTRLDFGDGDDYPLYTNVVQPYYRADHVLIGFPSRYVERQNWSANFDRLAGAERRRQRMKLQPRYGLTTTDCLFMSSRDGKLWRRWDEAFMRPGPEREYNWVYGDCFPAVGMIETPSALPYAPHELSLYAFDNHWGQIPAVMRRYTIRVDGFVSRHATYKAKRVVLKPFTFAGSRLSLNFATSAAGSLHISLHAGNQTLQSGELFGDALDRTVDFIDAELAGLAGQPVTMEIVMRDADIYSFRFE